MADIEKVIKGLECCRINELRHINCADCPYYTDDDKGQMWCSNDVHNDAIELLKERVKTKVVFKQCDGSVETSCGNCGYELDKTYSRCPKCQKELDWN